MVWNAVESIIRFGQPQCTRALRLLNQLRQPKWSTRPCRRLCLLILLQKHSQCLAGTSNASRYCANKGGTIVTVLSPCLFAPGLACRMPLPIFTHYIYSQQSVKTKWFLVATRNLSCLNFGGSDSVLCFQGVRSTSCGANRQ